MTWTASRPRTSTRDPEEIARRLTGWLGSRLPGAKAVGVTVPQSNGMSGETLLFDIEHPEPPLQACALRLAADPAAYTVFPVYDMPRQYRTMRVVAEHSDLPVPKVLWLEEDPGPLGAPFFVMERVEGRVPPDVMPYTYEGNWLHAASDAEREHLEAASVGILARLHDQVPPEEAEFLALPGEGDALRRHVTAMSPPNAPTTTGSSTDAPAHPSSRPPSTGWRSSGPATRALRSSPGATHASGTSSTRVSNPRPSSTGRWRPWPRARSTSAGPCICTASSTT